MILRTHAGMRHGCKRIINGMGYDVGNRHHRYQYHRKHCVFTVFDPRLCEVNKPDSERKKRDDDQRKNFAINIEQMTVFIIVVKQSFFQIK